MQLVHSQTTLICSRSGRNRQTPAFKAASNTSFRPASYCRDVSRAFPGPCVSTSPFRGSSSSSICRATAAVATAEPGKTTLGFCGIGIMGLPMVSALSDPKQMVTGSLLCSWCVSTTDSNSHGQLVACCSDIRRRRTLSRQVTRWLFGTGQQRNATLSKQQEQRWVSGSVRGVCVWGGGG